MREVVVGENRQLVFRDGPECEAEPGELVVAVKAISLNRGEVRLSRLSQPVGYRPGWDMAGIVEKAAANGKGPGVGERVVAIIGYNGRPGAWAERVAVHTDSVAVLPNEVSFAQAACLPVAGLTALLTLDKRGSLLGRRVLIVGGTGGVGHLAIQLARIAGAHVVATVRRDEQIPYVQALGAHDVASTEVDLNAAAQFGPYDLILDSLGGASAGAAMNMLRTQGRLVLFGATDSADAHFNLQKFYFAGGASVYGFVIFNELARSAIATEEFGRLLPLVQHGRLSPHIGHEASWNDINAVAEALMMRSFPGKAVLHL